MHESLEFKTKIDLECLQLKVLINSKPQSPCRFQIPETEKTRLFQTFQTSYQDQHTQLHI